MLGMQPDPAIVRLVPDWEHRAKVASSATPVQIGDLALLRRVKQSDWIYVRVASLSENTTFEKLVSLRLAPGPVRSCCLSSAVPLCTQICSTFVNDKLIGTGHCGGAYERQ